MSVPALERLRGWFTSRGWSVFPYQEGVWEAHGRGESGLVHVPTGMGKTWAAYGGPLLEAMEEPSAGAPGGLRLLWITPMRALARDTARALREPLDALGVPWTVELRTGDTPSSRKARQRRRLPEVLVTTPESLSILLSYPEAAERFSGLGTVVVDEWHEALGSKRGVQTELGLARLRRWNPDLRTWGLSATLGNQEEALEVLLGRTGEGRLHHGPDPGPVEIESLIPADPERFPWAGHLGLNLLPAVVEHLDAPGTALLFTNTRSQAERWFQALLEAKPEWAGDLALHHGSLGRDVREVVEDRLRRGDLRCAVCTSSLDLGVDFSPVDRVLQVGSPKGVGRLLQRAGRSGHRPGGTRRIVCVPTHALELVEFAAARAGVREGRVEARVPLRRPLDVLVQHLVTVALGGGFREEELYREVRTAWAYRDLPRDAWRWCLDFVRRGGPALEAYPRYARVEEKEGVFTVPDRTVARRHRMSVGTITSDGALEVRFQRGKRLGTVEESFLSRLRPGDRFVFAGRVLELLRIRDMVAQVRLARSRTGAVPRWMGGRLPLSGELGDALARELGKGASPERAALAPLLEIQERWSAVPDETELLLESVRTREGDHLFVFPFLGRFVHEGLAALLAYRLTRERPRSVRTSANDYGLELLSPDPFEVDRDKWARLTATDDLLEDLLACLNATELARRRFREIARVSGLVFQGYPGRGKSARQIQASSGLIFDVLDRWDSENLLLDQARREVLEEELELRRLRSGLEALGGRNLVSTEPPRLTPMALPVWAERIQAQVSSESWSDRVRRMVVRLERAAERDGAAVGGGG